MNLQQLDLRTTNMQRKQINDNIDLKDLINKKIKDLKDKDIAKLKESIVLINKHINSVEVAITRLQAKKQLPKPKKSEPNMLERIIKAVINEK